MLTLSLCVHRKTVNRCHILSGSWRGNRLCFFFHQHQSHHQFVDSVGRKTCVCVYLSMSICVYAWVYAPVHLCTCVGLFLCYVSMHLWVSHTNIQIRKCSTGNSEPKTDQNKSCFLIFSGQCVYVCIHYISRWERTNTAEQRARSLQKGKQQNHLPCSLQEGSGWKEWKNTSHIQCMWKIANTCIDHKHIHVHVHIHTHSFGKPFNSNE